MGTNKLWAVKSAEGRLELLMRVYVRFSIALLHTQTFERRACLGVGGDCEFMRCTDMLVAEAQFPTTHLPSAHSAVHVSGRIVNYVIFLRSISVLCPRFFASCSANRTFFPPSQLVLWWLRGDEGVGMCL
jgi:hypothetical protein